MVTIAYLMLKNYESYRYAKPELMREKFAKLQGPGRELAEGLPTLQTRTKAKAGLTEVYRLAQLPPATAPEGLPAGERRMLSERELDDFVRGLYEGTAPDPGGTRGRGPTQGLRAGFGTACDGPPGGADDVTFFYLSRVSY